MTKIVYGVSGEGSGHSSRAREMIAHLESRGHDVKVASYDRGYEDLHGQFDTLRIQGLHIGTDDNRVSIVETFMSNLRRLPEGVRFFRDLRGLFEDFRPHCVITDFEPQTAYLANQRGVPLITLDNQHRMRYMSYPCPRRLKKDGLVTEMVIRAMIPRPDVSLVTTFWFGETRNERTFLFPPILRQQVRETRPEEGDHVLVYVTQTYGTLLRRLTSLARERFLVYGFGRTGSEGNLEFRPFSRAGFLRDLASCRAVVATAGFTLMTESFHLGKPCLALPMRGQFEQQLNALLLEDLGYGRNGHRLTAETIGDFLYRLPEYRERLRGYVAGDDGKIRAKLDELVEDEAARAMEFHRHRQNGGA